MEVSHGHHEFETHQEDHVVDNPIARGEKHQVAMGEDHQVAMTSLTSAAWPVLQRWVEECHEAAREKATRHIQSCLRSQMLEKWAQTADVIPPGLVSSSSDDDRVNHYLSSGSEEESTSNSEDDAADVQMWARLLKQDPEINIIGGSQNWHGSRWYTWQYAGMW